MLFPSFPAFVAVAFAIAPLASAAVASGSNHFVVEKRDNLSERQLRTGNAITGSLNPGLAVAAQVAAAAAVPAKVSTKAVTKNAKAATKNAKAALARASKAAASKASAAAKVAAAKAASATRKASAKASASATAGASASTSTSISKAPTSAAPATGAYAPGSVFMTSALAAAAAQYRCGSDATCRNQVTVPGDATAFCVNRECTFRCNVNYAPSGTECALEPNSCPNEPNCPQVNGGYTTCDGTTGQCVENCTANQGLALYQNSAGDYSCVDVESDANNCGTVGNVCGGSYNGVGTAACRFGTCTLNCPGSTTTYSASSPGAPLYCA